MYVLDSRLQRASALASADRCAGDRHADRIPYSTLRGNDAECVMRFYLNSISAGESFWDEPKVKISSSKKPVALRPQFHSRTHFDDRIRRKSRFKTRADFPLYSADLPQVITRIRFL